MGIPVANIIGSPVSGAIMQMDGLFGLQSWQALLAAVLIFLIGNEIRIRSEEKLLRETFGAKFDEYASRVPAFFPRLL